MLPVAALGPKSIVEGVEQVVVEILGLAGASKARPNGHFTGPDGRQLGSELPPQAVSFRTVQAGTRWSAILSFDDAISLTD